MKKPMLKKRFSIILVDDDLVFVDWLCNKLHCSRSKAIKLALCCLRDDWTRNHIYK